MKDRKITSKKVCKEGHELSFLSDCPQVFQQPSGVIRALDTMSDEKAQVGLLLPSEPLQGLFAFL